MMKKFVSFILVAVFIVSLIPNISNSVSAATTLTETQFASKIADLQKEYPNQKYWSNKNGTVASGKYKGTSLVGDKTCSGSLSYSSKCGTFVLNGSTLAYQCHGFALLMAQKVFDSNPNTNKSKWEKSTSKNRKIYAGDVIRIDTNNNGTNEDAVDHTIFVYKVTSSEVYYVDCNGWYSDTQGKAGCQIRWSKKTLADLQ